MDNKYELKPWNFKKFLRYSWFLRPLLGVAIGGLAGLLYYYFVGCSSGRCPITGNSFISIIWGGILGYFVVKSPCSSSCKLLTVSLRLLIFGNLKLMF